MKDTIQLELVGITEYDVKESDEEYGELTTIGDAFIGVKIQEPYFLSIADEDALARIVLEHINAYFAMKYAFQLKGKVFARDDKEGKIACDFVFDIMHQIDFTEAYHRCLTKKFFLLEYKVIR